MQPNGCRGGSIPLSPLQRFPFPCPLLRFGNLSGSHALPHGIPDLRRALIAFGRQVEPHVCKYVILRNGFPFRVHYPEHALSIINRYISK